MMRAVDTGVFRAASGNPRRERRIPVGTDVLIRSCLAREALAERIAASGLEGFRLRAVEERAGSGRTTVPESSTARLWRCRFERAGSTNASFTLEVMALLDALSDAGLDWVRTEHRYAGS